MRRFVALLMIALSAGAVTGCAPLQDAKEVGKHSEEAESLGGTRGGEQQVDAPARGERK